MNRGAFKTATFYYLFDTAEVAVGGELLWLTNNKKASHHDNYGICMVYNKVAWHGSRAEQLIKCSVIHVTTTSTATEEKRTCIMYRILFYDLYF